MIKNNDWLTKAMIIMFINGLFVLLFYYFGTSLTEFSLMLLGGTFLGLIFGMLVRLFFGYLNPTDTLFQNRYTLEGIGWGFMVASIIVAIGLAENQHFGATDVVLPIIFGTFFGITWTKSAKHKNLKNSINNFPEFNSDNVLFSDSGSLTHSDHLETKGRITLTRSEIIFNPSHDIEQSIRFELSEISPQLDKSWVGFFKIPTGIQLTEDQTIKPAKFPRYWLEKIKMMSH